MAIKKFQITDSHLTELAQGYKVGNVIYDKVLPVIKTDKTEGKYIVWDGSSFKITSSRRAMGANVKNFDHDFERKGFSLPDGYSRKVSVDDRADRQTKGISNLSLLAQKLQIERRKMEFEKEMEVAGIITNVANFNLHGAVDNAGTGGWGDVDADIFGDVEDAKGSVADTIGTEPDTMLITRDVRAAMRKNGSLQKFFLNTGEGSALLVDKKLSDIFEMDVVVANSIMMDNDGNRVNIWGSSKCILLYKGEPVGPGPQEPSDMDPRFGCLLQLNGNPTVRKGYNQEDGIEWAVCEDNWLGLQTSKDAGYFFDAPLT